MIDIKDISGKVRLSVSISDKSVYKKELMKEEYVLLTFSSDTVIGFKKRDYMECEFGKFELVTLPVPSYNNETGGYDYQVRFDIPLYRSKDYILFYTRQGNKEKSWSLTAKIEDFLKIIKDNLKKAGIQYNGLDYELVHADVADIAKPISFDSSSIWDAFGQISEEWETEWFVSGNVITFGKCEFGDPVVFDSSNMSSIEKDSDKNKPTRIYPFGSTKNLSDYYGKELIFEVTDKLGSNIVFDRGRKLKDDFFLSNRIEKDSHPITTDGHSLSGDLHEIKYPLVNIDPTKEYEIDFSNYSLYVKTGMVQKIEFWFGVYSLYERDYIYEGFFFTNPDLYEHRIPLKSIASKFYAEGKVDIAILVSNVLTGTLIEFREEGSIDIHLAYPMYHADVSFISGMESGNTYSGLYNPDAIKDVATDHNIIQIGKDTLNFSVGDKYKLSGLKYDKMPLGYFTDDHKDEGVVTEGVVEKRLRLPNGMDHVDAWDNMFPEDVVEGVAVFDDIYPRKESKVSFSDTVDRSDDDKKKYTAYIVRDDSFQYSGEYDLPDEDLKIKFETGTLAGLEFKVLFESNKDDKTRPGSNAFEIVRNDDYGAFLPNDIRFPKLGDKFVLSGYDVQLVSDSLILEAELELLNKATEYVKTPEEENFTCNTNPVRCAGYVSGKYSKSDELDYEVGQKVNIVNPIYSPQGKVSRIYGFEKRLDHKFTCQYTVGDKASPSRLSVLEEKVENLIYGGQAISGTVAGGNTIYLITSSDSTPPGERNAFSSKRSKLEFISRLYNDEVSGHILFKNGITVESPLSANELKRQSSDAVLESGESTGAISINIVEEGDNPEKLSSGITEISTGVITVTTLGDLDNVSEDVDNAPEGYVLRKQGEIWVASPETRTKGIVVDDTFGENNNPGGYQESASFITSENSYYSASIGVTSSGRAIIARDYVKGQPNASIRDLAMIRTVNLRYGRSDAPISDDNLYSLSMVDRIVDNISYLELDIYSKSVAFYFEAYEDVPSVEIYDEANVEISNQFTVVFPDGDEEGYEYYAYYNGLVPLGVIKLKINITN